MILFGKTVFTYSVVTQRDCIDFSMVNTETNGIRHYEISSVYNQLDKIISSLMCGDVYWCAYNGRYHDETILNYCIINYNELKNKSIGDIIFRIDSFADIVHTHPYQDWINYKHAYKFNSFDLAPLFYNKGIVQFEDAVFECLKKVVDSNIKVPKGCFLDRRTYSRELSKSNALIYNELLVEKSTDVFFREFIEREYPIRVMNDNITTIGTKLFKLFYNTKSTFKPIDNRYSSISINDIIPKSYNFNFAGNNAFLSELRNININPDYVLSVVLPERIATLTSGGLKGFAEKGVFDNKSKHIYYVDFKSAWPSVAINFKITPDKMSPGAFSYALETMLKLRGCNDSGKTYSEQFKLATNSFIGSLMLETSGVHDFKAFMTIKVMSALETISLIESLGDIDVLQINNDGIVFMSDKTKNAIRLELDEWEEKHNIQLNFKEYKLFCQYSINDWFAVASDLNIITSGFFKYGSSKYPLASAEAARIAITDNINVDAAMSYIDTSMFELRRKAPEGKKFILKSPDGQYIDSGRHISFVFAKKGVDIYLINNDNTEPKLYLKSTTYSRCAYNMIDIMLYTRIAYQLYSELTITQQKLF